MLDLSEWHTVSCVSMVGWGSTGTSAVVWGNSSGSVGLSGIVVCSVYPLMVRTLWKKTLYTKCIELTEKET